MKYGLTDPVSSFRPRRSTPPHRDGNLIVSTRCHRFEIHQESIAWDRSGNVGSAVCSRSQGTSGMLDPTVRGLTQIDQTAPARLERLLRESARCAQPWLDSGLRLIVRRPGQRLRSALVFAAAACGPRPDMAAALPCAAAVELLHLSSLVHDDLMDDTDSRGGLSTLHISLGVDGAILAGDYLLAISNRL